jgi:hypothetical protein
VDLHHMQNRAGCGALFFPHDLPTAHAGVDELTLRNFWVAATAKEIG